MKKICSSIINYRRDLYVTKFLKQILIAAFAILFANRSFADYTVAIGQNTDASTITGQSGVLTVNGTLTVYGNGDVYLLGFTSVVINCPGQIYWDQNADLHFAAGTSVDVAGSSTNCGLQPTGGSASASLWLGTIEIAVSNDNSNNAAYSFAQFNNAGGLAAFTYTGISPVCYGSSPSVTLTPTDNIVNFNCAFAISSSPSVSGASISPAIITKFQGAQTATLTAPGSTIPVTYTITCTITRTADAQQDPIAIKTFTVTVYPIPTSSPALTAYPCLGNSATINATATNASSYQWQFSTDGGSSWSNLPNSSPYSGTTTSALGVSSTGISMSSYIYRVQMANANQDYNGAYCSATSTSVPLRFTNEWLGSSSANWATTGNWINNTLPNTGGACPTIAIPAGTSFLPKLDISRSYQNISIASGASLDLNGKTLTLTGAFTGSNTGYLKGSTSSGLTTSGTTGSLYFDQTTNGTTNALKNLTISSGSATLGNALNIAAGTYASPGTLTANGTLSTNDLLTLKSNASGDAMIGNSSGSVSGKAIVERYIPAVRAWRFLAAPFSSSGQTINDAWQEGYTNSTLACPAQYPGTPGYGTEITYNGTNGYDLNATTNPSIKVWVNNAWTYPGGTNINLNSYPAYCLFVRGDRTVCLSQGTAAIPNNTVLRALGTLNETGLSFVKNYPGSASTFVFVGNPFASAINVLSILNGTSGSGFDANKMWVWDPKIGGSFGVGGYVTYSSGLWAPAGGSYSPGSAPVIQSGQAFMVQLSSSSANAAITFKQSQKTSSESNVNGLQPNNPVSQNNATSSRQTSAENNTNNKKAYPFPVVYANLMNVVGDSLSLADGVAAVFSNVLSKNSDARNAAKNWNTNENMSLVRDGKNYAIEFRPMPVTDTLFFRLYLRQNQPYALKIFTQSIPERTKGKALLVDKYLNTKTPVDLFDTTTYSFTPNTDTNSYRNRFMIVYNRKADEQQISAARQSAIAASTSGVLSIFPNPVTGHSFSLQVSNIAAGKYEVLIYDNKGAVRLIKELQHTGNNANYKVMLPSTISAGVYNLVLKKDNLIVKTVSLVVAE